MKLRNAPQNIDIVAGKFVRLNVGGTDFEGADPASAGRLPEVIAFGAYLVLTNVGASYDAIAISKGLGIAVIDFTGVTSIDFRVFCNKIGTGTQSWQLWNVTDGLEIGVINDNGTVGDKVLNVIISTGIPAGKKVVRVRVKSTTAADDPVYYGSTVELS